MAQCCSLAERQICDAAAKSQYTTVSWVSEPEVVMISLREQHEKDVAQSKQELSWVEGVLLASRTPIITSKPILHYDDITVKRISINPLTDLSAEVCFFEERQEPSNHTLQNIQYAPKHDGIQKCVPINQLSFIPFEKEMGPAVAEECAMKTRFLRRLELEAESLSGKHAYSIRESGMPRRCHTFPTILFGFHTMNKLGPSFPGRSFWKLVYDRLKRFVKEENLPYSISGALQPYDTGFKISTIPTPLDWMMESDFHLTKFGIMSGKRELKTHVWRTATQLLIDWIIYDPCVLVNEMIERNLISLRVFAIRLTKSKKPLDQVYCVRIKSKNKYLDKDTLMEGEELLNDLTGFGATPNFAYNDALRSGRVKFRKMYPNKECYPDLTSYEHMHPVLPSRGGTSRRKR